MPGPRDVQLVICGLGGQGTVFLTRLLAEAALREGREVLTAETHGMAQRGGAVESHLKLGTYFGSTVRRRHADAVIALDSSRIEAGQAYLRAGGVCFANAAGTPEGVRACDASRVATERELPRGTNLVLLGFAMAVEPALFPGRAALLEALDLLAPPAARVTNRQAFAAGEEAA
jgi:indolepyruvate ferredoxin oxidoreductase beta subunit